MTEYGASGGDGVDVKRELHTKNGTSIESDKGVMSRSDASAQETSRGGVDVKRELHTKNGTSIESDKGVMSRSDASAQETSRGPSSSPQTEGKNPEERQTSRPKAQQDSRSSQPEAVAIDHRSPPALVEAAGMNAKARRAAKRAAERAEAEAGAEAPTTAQEPNATKGGNALVVAPSTKQTTVSGTKPTSAKERRAAKRAAAREALTASAVTTNTNTNIVSTSPSSETVPHAAGTGDYSSNSNKEGMTSKERRLLRRQEERKKREREGEADRAECGTSQEDSCLAKRRRPGGGGGGTSGSNPHIVFVGQLAFKTSAEDLEDHFKTRGGVKGKISVRLLTRKGTNPPRSRGMAFVELEDAETAYHCLTLHHSRLDGRLINVERTSGGGKEKKGERIRQKRGEQKEFMKTVVQRVLAEFIEAGRLGENELDDAAKGVLEKMEAKVMERAVKDYCDKPDRLELHNPSAWFTHHAHELAFRADPEDLDAGARDWLDREHSMKDTRRLTRGNKGNGDSTRGSRGVFGGRDPGQERKGGGRGRGGMVIDGRGKHGGDYRASSDVPSGKKQKTAYAPGYAPGVSDGSSSASFIQVGELKGKTSSDLVSIFPSLRGRGGAATGRRGGRGGRGMGLQ